MPDVQGLALGGGFGLAFFGRLRGSRFGGLSIAQP